MNFTVDEIVKATDAEIIKSAKSLRKHSVSTDSRKIEQGQIYLPLKGENFDGKNFIENVLESRAAGYFTDDRSLIFDSAEYIFYVEDTKEAYLKLASYYKNKVLPITIAITGSSGKTTTKEMLYHVVSQQFKAHKSLLNYNNEIGLCQTLLSMPCDTDVLITEMGMRGIGEIELLSKYAEPDIAIISNVGHAHIGRLGSIKNIAKAKCEITKYLHTEGTLIAHDSDVIKDENSFKGRTIYFNLDAKDLKILELTPSMSTFVYKNQEYKLYLEGEHNIENAISVIEAGILLGIPSYTIAKGLEEFKPIEKRWESETIKGFSIINDSYNANPDSVKAALKTFLTLYEKPKVIVIGDMGELGKNEKKYHQELGEFLKNYKYDYLITVGKLAKYIKNGTDDKVKRFSNNKGIAKFILKKMEKEANILFKASRSMKFEEIIEELKEL